MTDKRKINVRAISAAMGGAAILALSLLSLGTAAQSGASQGHFMPAPPAVSTETMQLGATTTAGVAAPTLIATMEAQPKITGPAALPSEEAALP